MGHDPVLCHQHLIVIADIGEPLTHERYAEQWMSRLVSDMGMTILINPKAVYCEMKGNRGLTAICAIETSHVALHIWDEPNPARMQLDVYTCSNLDLDTVWTNMKELEPKYIKYKFYDRDGDFVLLKQGDGPCE